MEVLRLGPQDLPKLTGAESLFDDPISQSATRAYLEDDRNVFLLAMEQGRPVGFLRGTSLRQISSDRPQMFIYEIGVDVDFRRQGAGRALIRALLDFCQAGGFEEAFVLTDPGNSAAVGLYRATGGAPETTADRMYVYRMRP